MANNDQYWLYVQPVQLSAHQFKYLLYLILYCTDEEYFYSFTYSLIAGFSSDIADTHLEAMLQLYM